MQHQLKSITDFLVTAVIIKYIVAHWIADRLISIFKKVFITSERDIAIWLHFKNKALNKSHKH